MSEERTESGELLTSFVTIVLLGVSIMFAWIVGSGIGRLLEWRISPFIAHALAILAGILAFIAIFVFLGKMADFLRKTFTADAP